jgi:DNA-binding NtrC family response regulator
MVTLTIDTGSGSELTYQVAKDPVSIGASTGNDVVLRAPGVAPVHVVIRRVGDTLAFICQQRQIVLLNSERRSRGVLGVGDRIRVGTATLTVAEGHLDDAEGGVAEAGAEAADEAVSDADSEKTNEAKLRSEVVVYHEPKRLADGRHRLLDVFVAGVREDLLPSIESFLEEVFSGRRSMLAWLDQKGRLQPIASRWSGAMPQLPPQSFAELDRGNRIAVVRGGVCEILIYPVPVAGEGRVYLLLEIDSSEFENDRVLLAELAGMLAIRWENVSSGSAFFGQWESEAREKLETRLPGSSQAVNVLRDQLLSAARSSLPVLLYGRSGSGRAHLASLISSLCPTGAPWIRVVRVSGGDETTLRVELFGSGNTMGVRGLAERAGGGVVVVRDVQRMSSELQRQTASVIEEDSVSGYSSKVRWILTGDEEIIGTAAGGGLDASLFNQVQNNLIRVPSIEERREDLPLIVVRMLGWVGAEQGKQIRGIALETLDSLLDHPFDGQIAELLGELRRLVSATPEGEMVRGSLQRSSSDATGFSTEDGGEAVDTAVVLSQDDLKVVIPAVERLLIDRVLRRSLGNQSKAARELNLSRGALIAKIKEYGIQDYRALRRNKQ